MDAHPHADPQAPEKTAEPSAGGYNVPVVPPQHALHAEVAAVCAFGLSEHHLGRASRHVRTTNSATKMQPDAEAHARPATIKSSAYNY